MQHYHVLKKLNLDPYHRVAGGVRVLSAKYLLVCCCICDSLKFDMQHDDVLKMLKFDLLTPPPGSWGEVGGVSVGKKICYHVAAFIIPLNLICKMTMLWRNLNFDLLDPPQISGGGGAGVCGSNICYHVAAFVIPFNLICNMNMLYKC